MKRRTLIAVFAVVTVLAGGVAIALTRVMAAKIRPPDGTELVELAAGEGGDAVADAGEADETGGKVPDRGGKPRAGGKQPRPRGATLEQFMRPIMDRSLFDSSKVGSTGDAIVGAEGEEREATDLGATLILTSVAGDRAWSTALILVDAEDAYPHVFLEGDALADAKIDLIGRRRVYVVRQNGSREYIEIGGAAPKKKKGRSAAEDREGKRQTRGRIDWSEGITKIDDTHYQIERGSVDNALANLDRLSRDARVVPNFVDGKSNGFKIFSIKRNSAARNLGLRNNDVISGVNGTALSSPDKALELYSSMQSESHIELDIIRKGEPVTLVYDIL
jgi:general secretion pathway protein C